MAKKTTTGYAPTTQKSHGDVSAYDPTYTGHTLPTQNSIFTASTAQSITVDAESIDYLEALDTKKDRFIPHVDFATASNFAKFGSAEKYYEDAYTRIHNFYPYDGSKKEKVQWELYSETYPPAPRRSRRESGVTGVSALVSAADAQASAARTRRE